ncbi:hypothetical protein JRO89_XS11G0233000 [Xanthoceras sorbifolium]|uniref:Major facilitator superfamily (MFS) profile domain-containing protein n=1 Tax=Xanthoceras sorbifolium TaxID=99658 RepID=A0ABQ8HH23_9ROSI|nr:hypothetical protein JRO89_XS11G0233000 [Xanthoceras sorbifolium]
MEDTTPLICDQYSNSIEQVTVNFDQVTPFVSLDEMIEQSLEANFGCAQFVQAVLVSLLMIFDAQQAFLAVYTDAEPTWHCTDNVACNSSSNICSLSKTSWAWDGTAYNTIISYWSLECASSIITGLPSSCFFAGCLLGGFVLSIHGDSSLGRKKLLFLSCFGMSIAALATIFSTNIWVYSSLRFVTGVFRASIITTVLVLLMEMVGKKWRAHIGIISFCCFNIGTLSLPAMAYLNRNSSWKNLYVLISTPAILYCIVAYFFVSESPRWLFMHGHEIEAIAALKRLTSVNNHERLNLCLANNMPSNREFVSPYKSDLCSLFKDFFKRKWPLKRLLGIMTLAFGIGLVYYGMLLGVGNLGFDIYLSLTFNALLEIPAYFLTFFLIEKCDRTSSMLAFSIVSGTCSIISGVIGDGRKLLQIGFELASFFSICVAFNVVLIYATELFPTCVRNSATSMVRQATIFGAVLSPIVISAGRQNDDQLVCYGVFGLVILFCGLFAICLPETRGVTLCDTLDEQYCMQG